MAEDSRHELGANEPEGFSDTPHEIDLQLSYKIDRFGQPEFRHRITRNSRERSLSRSGNDQSEWSEFFDREDFVRDLDIKLEGDTIVTVETVVENSAQAFFWSRERSAIKTKRDRSDLFGELRYLVGEEWKPMNEVDPGKCRKIRFKAKYATGNPRYHKFSYNVRFRDTDNAMTDYEIDPDIKNPSS